MYTPRFLVSELWVCLRVLGLFRTFHAHTTMLNARPNIFCFRVLSSFAIFGFVSNNPRTQPRCSTPASRFIVSEFWVCCRVLSLYQTFHAHTTKLNAHPTIFRYRVLSLLSSFSFVWIDLTRYTKKKLNFSVPILISDFLRQMRYRWNRHHLYIMNIVFLNKLMQK